MIFPFKYQVYNCPLIIFLRPASFFFTSADESTNLSWAVIVVQAKKIWFILILNNEFRYEIGNRWIHYSLPTKNQGKQIEAKEENRYNDFILLASCCLRLSAYLNKFNQFLLKCVLFLEWSRWVWWPYKCSIIWSRKTERKRHCFAIQNC